MGLHLCLVKSSTHCLQCICIPVKSPKTQDKSLLLNDSGINKMLTQILGKEWLLRSWISFACHISCNHILVKSLIMISIVTIRCLELLLKIKCLCDWTRFIARNITQVKLFRQSFIFTEICFPVPLLHPQSIPAEILQPLINL